ncbi:MAG: hypothetical protein IJY28_03510 [Clostridia bacterium]|nr:hypothetical protein [Clostridia bacterium]
MGISFYSWPDGLFSAGSGRPKTDVVPAEAKMRPDTGVPDAQPVRYDGLESTQFLCGKDLDERLEQIIRSADTQR